MFHFKLVEGNGYTQVILSQFEGVTCIPPSQLALYWNNFPVMYCLSLFTHLKTKRDPGIREETSV